MTPAWESGRRATPVVVLALLAWTLGVVLAFQPEAVSNDGAQYLSIARNLLQGHPNATDVLLYEQHFATAQLPAPQGVFQPAYSYLVAAPIAFGISPEWSGLLVSLCCQLLSALLLYSLLVQALHLETARACVISLAWLLLAINLSVVADALSEPVFVAATLGSVWCLWRSTQSQRPVQFWILSGALALLAFETRYAGLFFVCALGAALGLQWLIAPTRNGFVRLAVWSALPVLGIVLTFMRNYAMLGSLLGGPSIVEHHSPAEVLRNFYWSVSGTLGWTWNGPPAERLALLAAAVALAGFLFVALRRPGLEWRDSPLALLRQPVMFWSGAYVAVTMGALAWMSATAAVPASVRYLQPLWPFVFLLAGAMLAAFLRTTTAPRALRIASTVLLLTALALGQRTLYRDLWTSMHHPEPRMTIERVLATRLGRDTLRDCLQYALAHGRPLLTNEPQQVALALNVATIGLPISEYATHNWDGAATNMLLDQFGVEWILWLPSVYDLQAQRGVHQAPVLAELRAGRTPPGFEVSIRASDFVVLARKNGGSSAGAATVNVPLQCSEGADAQLSL
jgi:hypothetical protein